MNRPLLEASETLPTTALVVQVEEAEMDEMWSFVQSKQHPRWPWHAIDHQSGEVLAYILASYEDQALESLMALLVPFGI